MTKVSELLSNNIEEVKKLKAEGMTHLEVAQYYTSDALPVSAIQVGDFCRKNKIASLGMHVFTGDRNPSKRPEVRNKISDAVSKLWSDGIYDDRVNGMLGKCGELHPSYGKEFPKGVDNPSFKGGKYRYRDKYLFYHSGDIVCERCGISLSNQKWDVHHIDENHSNNAVTNLMGLCVPCHQKFHMSHYKQPYVSVSRRFLIEASHYLPEYEGKCFFTHGHRYEVLITVKRRIDPDTGMVLDFHKFKDIVEEHMNSIFDHAFLNDYLLNPTSERFAVLLWATLSPHLKGIDTITINESRDTILTIDKESYRDLVDSLQIENEWLLSSQNDNAVTDSERLSVSVQETENNIATFSRKDD